MNTATSNQLLREMLRIRLIEERIVELYPQQQMRCPVHLCIGQEAIAVGACAALPESRAVFSGHRAHGHYLACGGNLPRFFAEMYGRATGCASGMGGSMHLVDRAAGFAGSTPIVGGTIPVAVGLAHGLMQQGAATVVAVFFGEGASEEGVFHESLNFAALERLPVLFICEDNRYSVYTDLADRQPAERDNVALARGMGLAAERGDGNDVNLVHRLAQVAVTRVQRREGPTLLQLSTYRWREHCGPNFDNAIGYRSPREADGWMADCPILRARAALESSGQFDHAEWQRWHDEISHEIDAAVSFALESPLADPRSMLAFDIDQAA